jgi:uncharacterized protein
LIRSPRLAAGAAAIVGLLLAASVPLRAEPPRTDGWVTDLAGFLSAEQEQALEALMASYEAGSGHEVALLTVPDLGGAPLERYALEVARSWGLGDREKNDAALILVAREERKIRIEVGRGLEGTLTDSISGRIIRDVMVPEFRKGREYAGLRAGIEAVHAAAGGDYGRVPDRRSERIGIGILPLVFIVLLFIVLSRHAGGRGSGRGRGRRGGTSSILPWLILGTLTSGRRGSRGWSGGGGIGGGGFGGFGGGGGFSGGGASGGW